MSKNIVIQENGVAENLTAEVIRTTKEGGGTCDWVPEDEVQLTKKVIKKSGEYKAEDDGFYGYEEVTVEGHETDDVKTKRKTITQNGVYYAKDDGVYAFSSVYINVKGSGKHDDGEGGYVIPDPSGSDGSAIVGENENGNEEMAWVEDGEVKRHELASYILLDTPPNKLEYRDGERINMAGAVVRGYLKDGTPYKNSSYADSVLPFHQYGNQESGSSAFLPGGIVFPTPQRADIDETAGDGEWISGDFVDDLAFPYEMYCPPVAFRIMSAGEHCISSYTATIAGELKYIDEWLKLEYDFPYLIWKVRSSSNPIIIFIGDNATRNNIGRAGAERGTRPTSYSHPSANAQSATINGITRHYWYHYFSGEELYPGYDIQPTDPELGWSNSDILKIFYADDTQYLSGGVQPITLTWPREGDRKFLTTTFEITVNTSDSEEEENSET